MREERKEEGDEGERRKEKESTQREPLTLRSEGLTLMTSSFITNFLEAVGTSLGRLRRALGMRIGEERDVGR